MASTAPAPAAPGDAPDKPDAPVAKAPPVGDAGADTAKPAPAPAPAAPAADDGLFGAWGALTGGLGGLLGGGDGSEGAGAGGGGGENPRSPGIPLGEMAANATSELGNAGKAAQAQLGKAAEEIGKGWGTLNSFLDEILAPPAEHSAAARGGGAGGGGGAPAPAAGGASVPFDASAERLHERFPQLDAAEEAVGTYECALVQKYRCSLNDATPEKTFPLAGALYVTPLTLAMYVVDDGGAFDAPFGVTVPFADVARVQRGQKAMLRIVTKEKRSFVFAAFPSDDEFKAALALIEHLVGSNEPQPPRADADLPPPPQPPAEAPAEAPAVGGE